MIMSRFILFRNGFNSYHTAFFAPYIHSECTPLLLEHPAQMMWVLETDFVGYFAYGFVCACQQILDAVNEGEVNVFNC